MSLKHVIRNTVFCICKMFKRQPSIFSRYDSGAFRVLCFLVVFGVLLVIAQIIFGGYRYEVRSHTFCYEAPGESLPDISENPPPKDKGMFFIDTTCISHVKKRIYLSPRYLCSIEAAAKLHPEKDIYVIFTSSGIIKYDGKRKADKALYALLHYDNIRFRRVDYNKYLRNTPLQTFVSFGIPHDSPNSQIHASNILKIVTLWRYGGITVDLNTFILKSLRDLGDNFVGLESQEHVSKDIVGLSSNGRGKIILRNIMKEMRGNYQSEAWSSLGETSLTRALSRWCLLDEDQLHQCKMLNIYEKETFSPNGMKEWYHFFIPNNEKPMETIKESYAMRTWDMYVNNVTDRMSFGKISKRLCPNVYSLTNGFKM